MLRHSALGPISSALYSPMVVSAIALSYESPTLPTDVSMPASASLSVYRIEVRLSRCNGFNAALQVIEYAGLALVGPPGLEPGTNGS